MWPELTVEKAKIAENLPFSGKTFIISGTLPGFSRTEAKEFIQSNGGKVTTSVSKNTSYLLVGENPGSKLDKAQDLNIEIIDEASLRTMVSTLGK